MWFQKEYMNEAFKIQSSNGSRLVFVGNFYEGRPRGPCWKPYEGGGFLLGETSVAWQFSGTTRLGAALLEEAVDRNI